MYWTKTQTQKRKCNLQDFAESTKITVLFNVDDSVKPGRERETFLDE